jgi:hypothetical protein
MLQMTVQYEGSFCCKAIKELAGKYFPIDTPVHNNGKSQAGSLTDFCATILRFK